MKKSVTKISRQNSLKNVASPAKRAAVAGHAGNISGTEIKSDEATVRKKSWMTPPPPVPEKRISKTVKADIVILGGGNAGVSAARAAAEAGASVVVLEKQPEDKYEFFGGEMGSVNSKYMLKAGVKKIDPMELVDEWQRRSGNRTNPLLVKQYAVHSGAAFDWLLQLLPKTFKKTLHIVFHPLPRHFKNDVNGWRSYASSVIFRGQGTGWGDAMKLMAARAKKLGAAFCFETTARQLVKEGKRVIGVIGVNAEGKYVKFLAKKGVLIACGDFGGNLEMVGDLFPEIFDDRNPVSRFRCLGRDGDGQKLGIWAGGNMEPGPRALMGGGRGGNAGPFGTTAFLRMNRHGKRFTNEASWACAFQAPRQPKGIITVVWDAHWRKELEYQSLEHGNVDVSRKKRIDQLTEELNALRGSGAAGGLVHDTFTIDPGALHKTYCAETLDELADFLGYTDESKKNFLATIKRYNQLAKKGVDEDFGKEACLMHPIAKGPFYGYVTRNDTSPFALVTLAGLVIDEHQRVLDDKDDPIPGLFATGNASGGRYALQYNFWMAGNSIGMAVTMGRLVGQYMAACE